MWQVGFTVVRSIFSERRNLIELSWLLFRTYSVFFCAWKICWASSKKLDWIALAAYLYIAFVQVYVLFRWLRDAFFPEAPVRRGYLFCFRAILPTAHRSWLDSYRLYTFCSFAGGRRRAGRCMFCSCSCFFLFCSLLLLLPSIIIEKSRFSHCHCYCGFNRGGGAKVFGGGGSSFLFEYGIYIYN